jgi:hypothetical protein
MIKNANTVTRDLLPPLLVNKHVENLCKTAMPFSANKISKLATLAVLFDRRNLGHTGGTIKYEHYAR